MADRAYMEEQGIEKALADALAKVIREKPKNGLQRIAELISPETYTDASQKASAPPPPPPPDTPPPPPADEKNDAPPPPTDNAPANDDAPPPPPSE
uniref:Uncharacterized protein n=1 Tax=Haptolina brevifila TaxID=156173 RepID=A0A7S2BH26_9EUKA